MEEKGRGELLLPSLFKNTFLINISFQMTVIVSILPCYIGPNDLQPSDVAVLHNYQKH